MKTLIFEPFSGAAGDMILGSLIGLGADEDKVRRTVESAVDVSVSIGDANKRGIQAKDVKIHVPEETHSRHYHELVDIIEHAGLPADVEKSDFSSAFEGRASTMFLVVSRRLSRMRRLCSPVHLPNIEAPARLTVISLEATCSCQSPGRRPSPATTRTDSSRPSGRCSDCPMTVTSWPSLLSPAAS